MQQSLAAWLEGAERGVILSVVCDHMLLLHPEQSARLTHKQPALTVGCLVEKLRIDALPDVIKTVVESEDSQEKFRALTESLENYRPLRISSKHMTGRELRENNADSLTQVSFA